MLILDANEQHEVNLNHKNEIVVILNSNNPVLEESTPTAAFILSPHNARWLGEMLKRKSDEAIASGVQYTPSAEIHKLQTDES